MKRLIYALMAAGFLVASCGFVAAERRPDAVKAQYPAKIDLGDAQGTIKGVATPAAEIIPAEQVPGAPSVQMTADGL